MHKDINMGIIIGNRGFFSDKICQEGRGRLLAVLKQHNINPIILSENEGSSGSVKNRNDAIQCASLFKRHSEEIKGVIVSLPNFGDEKSIAQTLKMSELKVPVLIHAFNDDLSKLDYSHRRDSFCGKISVCNNLRQYGINYTLTTMHTCDPEAEDFHKDLDKFIRVCNVVDKIKNARIGLVGSRPSDFNTVRFSEKILEKNGISVEPIGLLDFMNKIKCLNEDHFEVRKAIEELNSYMDTTEVPPISISNMAKLLVVYRQWIKENDIDAVAFQCWDSIQNFLEINPCLVMSIMSNEGIPSACESDVSGALSMYALQVASELPTGLVDWNNNYNNEVDKAVIFHCGNFPKKMYYCQGDVCPKVSYPQILASTLGEDKTYGAIEGRIRPGKVTFLRLTTDDTQGKIKGYISEGEVTEEKLNTFGSWGVVKVKGLQDLMNYICTNGFEHHVAVSLSSVGDVLKEAFQNYFNWEVYCHK